MLRDLTVLLAALFVMGLGVYLLYRYPVSRSIGSYRLPEPPKPTPKRVHKPSQPFKSYPTSPVPERRCGYLIKAGKGNRVCGRLESEHTLNDNHFFTRQ